MKRVAIYARSSPDCPISADEQIEHLRNVASERGWTVSHVFADRPTSVQKGPDRRPRENELIEAIRSGAIDRVLIWSIDRVGKCLVDLIGFIEMCRSAHVALNLYEEGFDSETSNGLSLFDVSALLGAPPATIAAGSHVRGQAAAHASVGQELVGHQSRSRRRLSKAKRFLALKRRACDRSPKWQGFPRHRCPGSRPR